MYAAHSVGIRLTGILVIFTPSLLIPMTVVISVLMWRSEGRNAPLALTQLAAGVMTLSPFFITGLCWAVAAFRPDRDPQSIMLLNDLGWVTLEMVTPPAMIQFGALAIAILLDRSPTPFLPRWIAWYSFSRVCWSRCSSLARSPGTAFSLSGSRQRPIAAGC
jgi:hypothetical protein